MAINKVIYGTSTLIDLTADTVAADTLGKDISAHDKSGAEIIGTLESGGSTGGGDNCYIKKYSASDNDRIHGATPFTFTHNLGRIPRFINITSSTTEITAYSLNYITAIADATGIYLSYWDVSGSKNDWNELEVYSNHMSFPSNGFIGKASYVQIGNANESTIDIKVGESGNYFLNLSNRNVIIG
mgnify:CR=1 FL=1|uniref:Uncharacterized protein n=1 Tax=Siphoviridae sp. ctTBR23 TaxID=2825515 RepID=A0A8S5NZG9_9CAUD|nr:MAG TPA: hypothetical protein [Siphoviridae sp. ctTBR23]